MACKIFDDEPCHIVTWDFPSFTSNDVTNQCPKFFSIVLRHYGSEFRAIGVSGKGVIFYFTEPSKTNREFVHTDDWFMVGTDKVCLITEKAERFYRYSLEVLGGPSEGRISLTEHKKRFYQRVEIYRPREIDQRILYDKRGIALWCDNVKLVDEREFVTPRGGLVTFSCFGKWFEIRTESNKKKMVDELFGTRSTKKAPNFVDIDDGVRYQRHKLMWRDGDAICTY
uniref:Str_synth domain-containing protein n=1 Tax=Caenorhabditis tropicalis TaxID=1561998 RepID=A0A1I7TRJ8_9PELO